ncbi:hypothetical protein B0H21DRAFT_20129 [Amylocystis lapponica]|nr:hypothetical protein B0H21DRAFT_20129 [Amylocystis lapponica]
MIVNSAPTVRSRVSSVSARLYVDAILFRLPNIYARAHEDLLAVWNASQSGEGSPEEFEAEWDCFSRDLKHEWRRVYLVSHVFLMVILALNIYTARDAVANSFLVLANIAAYIACFYGFSYTVLMPDISGVQHGERWMQGAERLAASSWRSLPMILAASSASIVWAMLALFACLLCMYAGLLGLYEPPAVDPDRVLQIPLGICVALGSVALVGLAHFGASFWAVRKLVCGPSGVVRSRGGVDETPVADVERVGLLENDKPADAEGDK